MDSVDTTPGTPQHHRTWVVIAGVAALLLTAAVLYLAVGGGAPSEVAIDDAVAGLADAEEPTAAGATDETGEADTADADGAWTVSTEVEPFDRASSSGTFVGYRIDEELANVGATQAVGRTPAASGGLEVDGTTVTGAVIEGDLTQLTSDRPQRDDRVSGALNVDEHPTVRFAAESFELPAELVDGERVEVEVPGTLEAAGGSTDLTASMTAQRLGDVVVVTGSLDLPLADVGVTPPSAAIVLSVADTATIEWQLYLTRS